MANAGRPRPSRKSNREQFDVFSFWNGGLFEGLAFTPGLFDGDGDLHPEGCSPPFWPCPMHRKLDFSKRLPNHKLKSWICSLHKSLSFCCFRSEIFLVCAELAGKNARRPRPSHRYKNLEEFSFEDNSSQTQGISNLKRQIDRESSGEQFDVFIFEHRGLFDELDFTPGLFDGNGGLHP